MNFKSIIQSIPNWLNPDGPQSGIVISSRARLARNIKGIHYAHRATEKKLGKVISIILDSAGGAGFNKSDYFPIDQLDDLQKRIFIERHLISPSLAEKNGNRGVLVREGESDAILINEEDHLRIQSLRSGFDIMGAWEDVDSIDKRLSKGISFAFDHEYGYLTACPTNFGTGLRASILIHLPALVLSKEIQRVIKSSGQLGLAVRGYYGEGSDVVGNLFQISNQTSLGKSEHEIVDGLISVVNRIIEYEKRAANMLIKEAKSQIEDKIWRSVGILKTARVLSTHDFMNLSSASRLGLYLQLLDKPHYKTLNELMVLTQPGHLQARLGRQLEPQERDAVRAEIVRQQFVDVKI